MEASARKARDLSAAQGQNVTGAHKRLLAERRKATTEKMDE
jgi:hypothetical protein